MTGSTSCDFFFFLKWFWQDPRIQKIKEKFKQNVFKIVNKKLPH